MKFLCKAIPTPHPAFPKEAFHWVPLINVKLFREHSPPTKWLECCVDSGAPDCMFHASVCRSIGIQRVEDGIKDEMWGIIGGPKAPIYYHKVTIIVGSERMQTMAGFSWHLAVLGLLGRRGFFENFAVKIDSSFNPPTIELEKIHRT